MLYLPAEFPQQSDLCYLNHAAVAPWPKRTADAVQKFAFENMTVGAAHYPQWMDKEASLRERLAWLINARSPDDIALVKNTSEGLSFVASGLTWQAGDEIVGIADDFPSNRVVWESLADQGVIFRGINYAGLDDPEQALIDALTDKTRLLAVSSVHFALGVRLDLARLSQACQQRGILLCVDAIQSLGASSFDVQKIPADFIVADGHKWMLGPEGLALFYVNPALRENMRLTQFGWAMREKPSDYTTAPWQAARSARRFECGSPNMLGIHALDASLSVLQEVGFAEIEQRLQKNINFLQQALNKIEGCTLHTPKAVERRAGILSFSIENVDSAALYTDLMKNQVICANRGGFIRFSPHFYTSESVLTLALEKLQNSLASMQNQAQ